MNGAHLRIFILQLIWLIYKVIWGDSWTWKGFTTAVKMMRWQKEMAGNLFCRKVKHNFSLQGRKAERILFELLFWKLKNKTKWERVFFSSSAECFCLLRGIAWSKLELCHNFFNEILFHYCLLSLFRGYKTGSFRL